MEIKKISRLAILLALSIVLSILEGFLPFLNGFTIPGLKLGLANIVTVFVLYKYHFKEALCITVLRVILVGLLRTGLFNTTFFFSLGGALLSLIAMRLFIKSKLSVIGVSVIGSLFHSVGQISIAIILLRSIYIIYYLPWVMLFSLPTGIIIGIISKQVIDYFTKKDNNKYN